MKLSEYVEYDGLGLAELVRTGEVTAPELTKAALQAIDIVDDKIFAAVGRIAMKSSTRKLNRS